MSNKRDLELIKKYFQGDRKAFEELLDSYMNPIYRFVFGFVNSRKDAEDITQEVFFKVWKNLKTYKADFSFKTWIYKIAKNTVFDFLRKKMKKEPDVEIEHAEDLSDEKPLQDDVFLEKLQAEQLKNAMLKLPEKYKSVLHMRYIEDMAFKDISEIMSVSLDTIKTWHRRGLDKIKSFFVK